MRFEEPLPREAAVGPTEESLVEHVEWLRRLARSLVSDANDGEDAVQDTCLATLRHPPRSGPGLRAWLKRVLQRHVAHERSSRERRQARECAVGRTEALPSALEIADRIARERELAQAVAELPEAQRLAVWMRFWEHAPPRVIAERLGVPVETVRTRLKRALGSLRASLERSRGSEWKAALAPIAGLPAGVWSPVLSASALSGIAFAAGGIALKIKLWIAAGVVLAGAFLATMILAPTWLGLPEDTEPRPDDSLAKNSAAPLEGAAEMRLAASAIERQESPHTVIRTSSPTDALRLRVLDVEGRPVSDVEVGVRPRTSKGPLRQPIWRTKSDSGGRAVWDDAAKALAESEAELEAAVIEFVGVMEGVPLSKDRDPAEVVVLHLPPTGSVHLRVIDPEARPSPSGSASLMYALDPAAPSVPDNDLGFYGIPIREGEATFRFVALGVPLRAEAHPVAALDGSIDLEPLRSRGEVREAELRFDRGMRVLKVRLVREDGAPLARTFASVDLRFEDGLGQSTGQTSGPQGEFYLRVAGDPEKEREAHLKVSAPDYGSGEMTTLFVLADGMFDAGELHLKEDPIALAGRVLRDGQGTARVAVHFRFIGSGEKVLEDPRPFNTWSEDEGRFSYRVPGEAFQKVAFVEARVDHGKLQTPWTRFAPGTRDVVLSATAGGQIEIRPLPRELARKANLFRLRSGDSAPQRPIYGSTDGEKVVFQGLAGTYSVQVHTSGHPTTMVTELAGLEVRVGETCADPRLDPLDLSDRVSCFLFDLVPPEGREMRGGEVQWRRSGTADAPWFQESFYRELQLLLAPPGSIDIVIRVPGTRTVHLEGLERGCEVRLKPGISVILGLEANTALPPDCRVVWAHLERFDELSGAKVRNYVRLDDRLNQTGEIGEPGRYHVRWSLEIREKSRSSTQTIYRVADPAQEIEVLDVPGVQRFVLALPAQ